MIIAVVISLVLALVVDGSLPVAIPLLVVNVHPLCYHVAEFFQVHGAVATEVVKESVVVYPNLERIDDFRLGDGNVARLLSPETTVVFPQGFVQPLLATAEFILVA